MSFIKNHYLLFFWLSFLFLAGIFFAYIVQGQEVIIEEPIEQIIIEEPVDNSVQGSSQNEQLNMRPSEKNHFMNALRESATATPETVQDTSIEEILKTLNRIEFKLNILLK